MSVLTVVEKQLILMTSGTVVDSQRPFIDLQTAPQANAHLDVPEVEAMRLADD